MGNITLSLAKSLHDFLRPYNKVLKRPGQKALLKLLKGIIEGGCVQLTGIARKAVPDIMPKTFCEGAGKVLEKLAACGSIHLKKRKDFKWLLIDESDIDRKHAKKISVSTTWNGSEHESGKGYEMIAVVGITRDKERYPVMLRRIDERNKGREETILAYIHHAGVHHGGIWIADRGWDDIRLFRFLLEHEQEFLIRLDAGASQRHVWVDSGDFRYKISVSHLCRGMGKVGYRRVYLTETSEEQLTLIRFDHGRKEPLHLLTTLTPETLQKAEEIAEAYLDRWGIETYLRFIKQKFDLEETMLQKIERIDGLLIAVLLASSFVMQHIPSAEDQNALSLLYFQWLTKEQATPCPESFARFCAEIFAHWTLIFRTLKIPPKCPQQALFQT
jgi:hypothetical protein